MYTVYRVTPCTFLCSFERAYHIFTQQWRNDDRYIFVSRREPGKCYSPRRFYGSPNIDETTIRFFNKLNLKDAIEVPHNFTDNDLHYVPFGDVFSSDGRVALK